MIHIFRPEGILAARRGSILHRTAWRASATRRIFKPSITSQFKSSRYTSADAGQHSAGHIISGSNEGVLFFDNVFPLKIQRLLGVPFAYSKIPKFIRYFVSPNLTGTDPAQIIKKVGKEKLPIEVNDVLLRLKEGGAFVKFSHDGTISVTEVEKRLNSYLHEEPTVPWWSPVRRMQVHLVKGRPWVEDLFRIPTQRLKVEFLPSKPGEQAVELSQEHLYEFFRPYGKLTDIVPQPFDSKVLPRYAYLDFRYISRAIMAKNCMHGYLVSEAEGGGKTGTLLRLTYEQKIKAHWIRDWLVNHPRLVIPVLAAIIATITVAIFDPIRTFFIKAHILRTFHVEDNAIYNWIKGYATDIFAWHHRRDDDAGMEAVWDDRKGNIEQIQTWLMETADTFIIVQGPRGSGKRELVLDQALKEKRNKLVIDCKPIQEARGDSATINATAAQVGYRPVFSWMNSFSGMIDMAAQGAAGVKTGFSETLDTQLAKILNNTATALRQVALEGRDKDDKDANAGDDEYLEAHPEKRPIVVIDNFLHKSQESTIVYDKIAEWAARLTTANIAHVVFLTNDVSFSKSLSKALPDRVFRQISLSDCSPEVAKKFVITHLDSETNEEARSHRKSGKSENEDDQVPLSQRRDDLAELDSCIEYLGGRLTDLEFLARRIKTGETPIKAVHEIIDQSASEILKMYIFGSDGADGSKRLWTAEQAWLLIKQLATQESIKYNEILLSDTYKNNGESVLRALEQAELITITSGPNGRPASIRPGKPVYHPAFKRLTEDKVLKSKLDLQILTDLIKIENASIEKYENELLLLSQLRSQPRQMTERVNWLLEKVAVSQRKVEGYEREGGVLKGVLKEEF